MAEHHRRHSDALLSEDEKIERFYALIRNYKQARDRQRSERPDPVPIGGDRQRIERERPIAEQRLDPGGIGDGESRSRKRMRSGGDCEQPSWIPAFEWEDFVDKARVDRSPIRRSLVSFPAADLEDCGEDVTDPPAPPEMNGAGVDLKLRL